MNSAPWRKGRLGALAQGATVTKDVAFTVQFGASMTFFVTVTGGTDGVVPLRREERQCQERLCAALGR